MYLKVQIQATQGHKQLMVDGKCQKNDEKICTKPFIKTTYDRKYKLYSRKMCMNSFCSIVKKTQNLKSIE